MHSVSPVSPDTPSDESSCSGDPSDATSKPAVRTTRNGRVLLTLRRQMGIAGVKDVLSTTGDNEMERKGGTRSRQQRWVQLAPSSLMARLVQDELRGALTYHLVHLAQGPFQSPCAPPVWDLTEQISSLKLASIRSKKALDDPYAPILLQACQALGARRSSHSSIIGDATDAREVAARRELACRRLTDRLVDLLEEQRIHEHESKRAEDILGMVQALLWVISPQHSHQIKLGKQGTQRFISSSAHGSRSREADCALIQDSFTAVAFGTACHVRNEDLHTFGYRPSDILQAVKYIDEHPAMALPALKKNKTYAEAVRALRIYLGREVAALANEPLTASLDHLLDVYFLRLPAFLEVFEKSVVGVLDAPALGYEKHLPHFTSQLSALYGQLATQSVLRTAGRDKEPWVIEMRSTWQKGYLRWLKEFVRYYETLETSPGGRHNQAVLLQGPDACVYWVELAIQAAADHARGSGALAEADFSWREFEILRRGVKSAAPLYASAAQKDLEIEAALLAAGQREDLPQPSPVLLELSDDRLAQDMVSSVLDKIE